MKPMNKGVGSLTWIVGGVFHDGIRGRSAGDFACAADGKCSTIGYDVYSKAGAVVL